MASKFLMKKIKIGVLFDFPRTNSKITKDFCNRNKGKIPVYASSKDETSTLGYIPDNLKGVKYYENCLSWNRNGSVGYVFIRNHKFTTNEDHRAMLIKKEYEDKLDRLYLKFEIEKKLLLAGFSFLNKCGVAKIQAVFIEIPVDKKDEFDVLKQKELAAKYRKLQEVKTNLGSMYEEISNIKVSLSDEDKTKKILAVVLFDPKKGDAKYTHAYMRNHKGQFPVYSSQTINQGIISTIDTFDYDEECLTWTTDGIYAGTVFYRNGKFSMTTHCGALFLRDKYKGKIDLKYILYQLSLYLKDYATGEGNKRVTVKVMEKVPIKIIVDKNDQPDLIRQKQVADKFIETENIKSCLNKEFLGIINQPVNIV